jgi:hypothetical protein
VGGGDADDDRRVSDPDPAHTVHQIDALGPEPTPGLLLQLAQTGQSRAGVRLVVERDHPTPSGGVGPDAADEIDDRPADPVPEVPVSGGY